MTGSVTAKKNIKHQISIGEFHCKLKKKGPRIFFLVKIAKVLIIIFFSDLFSTYQICIVMNCKF